MKKLGFSICIIIIVALMTSCASFYGVGKQGPLLSGILQRGELIVGTAGGMPPLNMTTKNGDIIGFEVDLANIIADSLGVKLRIEAMAFPELLPALEAGEIDIILSGMTITPARNLKVAFAGPYYESGKALLTNLGNIAFLQRAEIFNIRATVVTLEGSTSQYFVEKELSGANLITTKDYDSAIKMVLDGKADALVADYPICVTTLLRNPNEGFISIFTSLTYEPMGIAMPLGDPHFLNWINNMLNTLEKTGRMEELEMKWFEDSSWLSQLP
jgi:polar amino acid transport system substrate-binding protein